MLDHPVLRHHKRIIAAAAVAFVSWWPLGILPREIRLVCAVDVFFVLYLVLILKPTLVASPQTLRARARTEDEGIWLIAGLTAATIAFSLVSIMTLLNKGKGPDAYGLALAIATVPLGWATLHTMAAQHYANLYYGPAGPGDTGGNERGGLDFPGDGDPVATDFLYFSFVLGMTAQTSDVAITSQPMRKAALAHSVASFFYNTVLVAIAVNAAIGGSGG